MTSLLLPSNTWALGLPVGTICATILLETITATFEMEEILYKLCDHSLGLNCSRWDYLFLFIKKFKAHPDKVTLDHSYVTMTNLQSSLFLMHDHFELFKYVDRG